VREYNRDKISCLILLSIVFIGNISLCPNVNSSIQSFFTLRAIITGGIITDYYNKISQQLNEIGIDLDIAVMDWTNFIDQLLYERNFDIIYFGLSGGLLDPDFTGIYNENGSLNLFGYDTSMDWDDDLNTGINEWYMKQGTLIMPLDSEERVQHYWDWEQYLMDKICPMLPMYNHNDYIAYWANLNGYNHSKGLLQSWGGMFWNEKHLGQNSTDEILISDAPWSDLNPLFQDDASSSFISNAVMDPLLWIDSDMSIWPHLAKNFIFINDTTLEITTREGIKWNADFEGNFSNEYFDVRDVYFTLYSLKTLSDNFHIWDWLKDMEIIDNRTLRIYIDGDHTTPENDVYTPVLTFLSTLILPEHYLNQTQEGDGVTPDINHPSWNNFTTNAFGTGLFEMNNFTEGVETILTVRADYWGLNETITSDPALEFERRFGDYSDIINQLKIRIIPDINAAMNEFQDGYLDIISMNLFQDIREEMYTNTNFSIQIIPQNSMVFLGFNMRVARGPIGSRELCPNDELMTKGLAIRKAICYAIDREEINNQFHDGEYRIIHWPIYESLGRWCNPNIIHYDHNLIKAYEMMEKAGYDIPYYPIPEFGKSYTIGYNITLIALFACSTVYILYLLKKSRKTRKRYYYIKQ